MAYTSSPILSVLHIIRISKIQGKRHLATQANTDRELPDGPPVEHGLGDVARMHRRIAALREEPRVGRGVGDHPVAQERVAVLIQDRNGVEVQRQNFQK